MGSKTLTFEYEEEDGYLIQREDEKPFSVFGKCSGSYTAYYYPGDRETPSEEGCDRDDFECEITAFRDEEGEDIKGIKLTKSEREEFEEYMAGRLDEMSEDSDRWCDCDENDYSDYYYDEDEDYEYEPYEED